MSRSWWSCLALVLAAMPLAAVGGPDAKPPTAVKPGQTWTNPKDGMEFVYVPAGAFTMGSDDEKDEEKPAHQVTLDGCWIGKTEVTIGQFRKFVKASGYQPQGKWEESGEDERLPVASVTWADAVAYCKWAGCRLPTEAEWERAARGADGRRYPWGKRWDPAKANTSDEGPKHATPVGTYAEGASPYGCLDMAGNVWEWCSSLHKPYPYADGDGREDPAAEGPRVFRGGSWLYDGDHARAAYRNGAAPDYTDDNLGFRCAMSAAP